MIKREGQRKMEKTLIRNGQPIPGKSPPQQFMGVNQQQSMNTMMANGAMTGMPRAINNVLNP